MKKSLTILFALAICLSALGQSVETKPGDPSIMEVAPYQPVKKESIKDKFERIAADGNAIGVRFFYQNKQAPHFEALQSIDQDTSVAYLMEIEEYFIEALKTRLGIDAIEKIDQSKLPVDSKMIMGTPSAYTNYWKTKYKVVISFGYVLDGLVNTQNNVTAEWTCRYGMYSLSDVYEYFVDPKKGKEKSKWLANINVGAYGTSAASSSSGCDVTKLEIASQDEIMRINKEGVDNGLDLWLENKYNK
jgi:hypothetical protein